MYKKIITTIFCFSFLALASCTKTTPQNTGKPVISFTQTNVGTITSLNLDPNSTTAIQFNVIANNPGGVKSVDAYFPGLVEYCTSSQGAVWGSTDGSSIYPYNPVPAEQYTSQVPDSNGQVNTELFVIPTVGPGPFTCDDFQEDGVDTPYGDDIGPNVTATDFFGNSATAHLPILTGSFGSKSLHYMDPKKVPANHSNK